MTGCAAKQPSKNVLALHLPVESFQVFAEPELSQSSPWEAGLCFNPGCGRAFDPTRDWQLYCCNACRDIATQELRTVGHKIAPAIMIWRLFKYVEKDTAEAELVKAARRYITHVQTAWIADRARRSQLAGSDFPKGAL